MPGANLHLLRTWWLPGAGEQWNQDAFPTAAGDTLTLTVEVTSENWLMTIANNTQGWTYTEVKSVLAVNIGSIHNNGAGPVFWPFPLASATLTTVLLSPVSRLPLASST